MNPNEQLEAIEKIINEAKKKAREIKREDEADGFFAPVVQAMMVAITRSRALHAIEKLLKDNDASDVGQQTEIEKIIRETEKKVDALDVQFDGRASQYYALGYQLIKQLVEGKEKSAKDA